MKLTVLQENLANALSKTSRFASSKAQLPVLGNIKFSTHKTKLNLASTNLEVAISVSIGAQIEEEGEITIPSKVITELVSNLPAGTLNLEVEKEQVKINSQGMKSVVSGMNASDFPPIPKSIDEKGVINLPKEEFLNSLSQIMFAASTDETRPILTGILLLFKKENLFFVATDGFRLSQKKLSLKGSEKEDSVILPRTALGEISRLSADGEQILFKLNKSENQVIFGIGDTVVSSRVLDGEFPPYEKIIPKSSTTKVNLDKEELIRAVKLASIFAREAANIVKISVEKDSIAVSAESQISGNQRTKIDAKIDGPEIEIAYNYRFLEEFLHAVKGEDIKIEFSGPNAPGVFLDPSDTDFLHLIMPVKLQS